MSKLRRRKKKRFLSALLWLVILTAISALGISFYIDHSTSDMVIGKMKESGYEASDNLRAQENAKADEFHRFDCILVLGASVEASGQPSPMLRDRLDLAQYLYNEGYSDKILVTGDNGEVEYNEVKAMEDYLLEKGVKEKSIVCDYAGFSTYDSIYRAKNIFGAKRILIVTQGYHLSRALYIAEALDLDAFGAASDQKIYIGQKSRDAREILARDKDFFMCIFKPKASIMGEPETL